MFPTANSQVFYNEDGEVLGWDTPSYDDAPEYDESVNLYGYDDEEPWCEECVSDGTDDLHDEGCRTLEDYDSPAEPYEDPNMYLSGSGERADDQSYIDYLNGGY